MLETAGFIDKQRSQPVCLLVVHCRRLGVTSETAPSRGERHFGSLRLASVRRMVEKSDHAMTEAEAAELDAATKDATAAAGATGGAIGGGIGAGRAGAAGGAA